MTEKRGILIVYDGECPFCSNYVKHLRIEAVDARSGDPRIAALWRAGHDLDQGMVVTTESETFHGAAALKFLGGPGSLYPLFKAARRFALWLKGVPPLTPK